MGVQAKNQQVLQQDQMKWQHYYDLNMFKQESRWNEEQTQQARDWEKNFYDYQFAKENQYNTPAAQVARFQQAGLNPALIAGQIDSGVSSPSGSSVGASSASAHNTVDAVGAFNATSNRNLQMLNSISSIMQEYANYASQRELNQSAAAKNLADAAKTSGVDTEKTKEEIKNLTASTANVNADTKLKESQTENVKQDTKRLNVMVDKFLPQQMAESKKRIEQIGNDILNSQQLTSSQVAKYMQDVNESISRANLNTKQAELVNKQIESFEERFRNEMNLSAEQFQQLKSQTSVIQLKNKLMNSILNGKFDVLRGTDYQTNQDIMRLRALMTLDPNPMEQLLPKGMGVDLRPYSNFGF